MRQTPFFAALLSLSLAGLAAPTFAQVTPPPLPTGSAMVTVHGGMDLSETARQTRAHHHKLHYNKDYMHDDSFDEPVGVNAPPSVQPSAASYAPQASAQRALAGATQASVPCPVVPAGPARMPTAGDLAAMQPRPGDVAALGSAARPAAPGSPSSGCLNTASRVAGAASAAARPINTVSNNPQPITNSRSTK